MDTGRETREREAGQDSPSKPEHFDWVRRCSYHKPSPEGVSAIEASRTRFGLLGLQLLDKLPDCEERTTALHYLQQSLMWANAAAAYRIAGSEVEAAQ